jgi:hypothetical protein
MNDLATQNMSVTATNVSVNGENVEGSEGKKGAEGTSGGAPAGSEAAKKQAEQDKKDAEAKKEADAKNTTTNTIAPTSDPKVVPVTGALNENTKENPNYESTWSDPKYGYEGRGRGATIEDRTSLEFKTDIKKHKVWDKSSGKWIEWEEKGVSKPDEYYDKSAPIGTDFNTTTPNPFSYDIPSNDALANKSGKWAVKTVNKSIIDYTHNFLKGMVSQNKDNLKAIASGTVNNNQNNSSSKQENHHHYTLNLDGKTIQNNTTLNKAVRETVGLSLIAKNTR